jgi:hypothetical protein
LKEWEASYKYVDTYFSRKEIEERGKIMENIVNKIHCFPK